VQGVLQNGKRISGHRVSRRFGRGNAVAHRHDDHRRARNSVPAASVMERADSGPAPARDPARMAARPSRPYNPAAWTLLPARASVSTKTPRRSAKGAWDRSIARAIRS
jgi:hypothetical protein